jgi:hypothetical protein
MVAEVAVENVLTNKILAKGKVQAGFTRGAP